MSLYARIEAFEPALAAVQATVATIKGAPDESAAVATLQAQVATLTALVGTPSATDPDAALLPAPAPATPAA